MLEFHTIKREFSFTCPHGLEFKKTWFRTVFRDVEATCLSGDGCF